MKNRLLLRKIVTVMLAVYIVNPGLMLASGRMKFPTTGIVTSIVGHKVSVVVNDRSKTSTVVSIPLALTPHVGAQVHLQQDCRNSGMSLDDQGNAFISRSDCSFVADLRPMARCDEKIATMKPTSISLTKEKGPQDLLRSEAVSSELKLLHPCPEVELSLMQLRKFGPLKLPPKKYSVRGFLEDVDCGPNLRNPYCVFKIWTKAEDRLIEVMRDLNSGDDSAEKYSVAQISFRLLEKSSKDR